MSGAGPFGPIAHGVWQSWQADVDTMYLPRVIFSAVIRIMVGDLTSFGMAKPDHRFYETHPVVNQLLPYAVGHGRVVPKPEIEKFEEDSVVFVDGSSAQIDMVVFATGYLATFDFIAPQLLAMDEAGPVLGRQIFSPAHPGVVVSGLIQPDSGQWTLAHWQAMLIAHYARARCDEPERALHYAQRVAGHAGQRYTGGAAYTDSTRHRYEVAHQEYLKVLQTDIRILEGSL